MPDEKGMIQIGAYPVDQHECFSEVLTCLSHALGGLDASEYDGESMDDYWKHRQILVFEELIYLAFQFGGNLEQALFGGEYGVVKRQLKVVKEDNKEVRE